MLTWKGLGDALLRCTLSSQHVAGERDNGWVGPQGDSTGLDPPAPTSTSRDALKRIRVQFEPANNSNRLKDLLAHLCKKRRSVFSVPQWTKSFINRPALST